MASSRTMAASRTSESPTATVDFPAKGKPHIAYSTGDRGIHHTAYEISAVALRDAPQSAMPSSTRDWHPAALAVDADAAVAYLDRVSVMPLLRQVAEASVASLQLRADQSVLEVGCGSGVFLPRLADAVGTKGRVVGIDAAAALVPVARHRVASMPQVRVEQASAYALPFADNSFDAAHCERVLMHLEEPVRALREMARVVKPGRLVVAAEPDWGGLQVASSDPDAATALLGGWLGGLAQPRMGLDLYAQVAEVGLVEVQVNVIAPAITDFAELEAYGADLERIAVQLEASGTMPLSRSRNLIHEWTKASADGRFFGYLAVMVVAARAP
jgi:SAM-dependent methyltransferase